MAGQERRAGLGLQPALVIALVAVGIGNITIPNTVPVLPGIYLPLALAFVVTILVLRVARIVEWLQYPFLILMLVLAFSAGFLVAPLNSYGNTKLLGVVIAIILIVAPAVLLHVRPNLWLIVGLLTGISVVTSVALLVIGQPDITGRSTLPGLNPIGTARVTGLAVVVALASLICARRVLGRRLWVLIVVAVPALLATATTGSRGPIVAIACSAVVLLAVAWRTSNNRTALGIFTVFAAVGAAVMVSIEIRSASRISSLDANGRDVLYSTAIDVIQHTPLGLGWGNFFHELPFVSRPGEDRLYAHNIFLEIGAEGGWAALAMFIALVAAALWHSWRAASRGDEVAAVILSLLVFLLVNASFSSDLVGNRLMWLFLGLALVDFSRSPQATSGRSGTGRSSPRQPMRLPRVSA